jgi:hypothetical protein
MTIMNGMMSVTNEMANTAITIGRESSFLVSSVFLVVLIIPVLMSSIF